MPNRIAGKPVVDFIGIGMGKAGTSWLWNALRQHPQLFLPEQKELQYFNAFLPEDITVANPNHAQPIEWYEGFFDERPESARLCGEFSPVYWRSANAAADIHAYNPAVQLIVTLREPLDYLVSDYLWRTRRGTIGQISIDEALESEEVLWQSIRYHTNMRRFLDLFPLEQFFVVTFDEIKLHAQDTLYRLHDWLGVERQDVTDESQARNTAAAAANPRLSRLFRLLRVAAKKYGMESSAQALREFGPAKAFKRLAEKSKPLKDKPRISEAMRARIRDVACPELEALGKALGRDFSGWCTGELPAGAAEG